MIKLILEKLIFNPNSGEKINYIEIGINETVMEKRDIKYKWKIQKILNL